MFRNSKFFASAAKFGRKFSSAAETAPESYSGAVQFLHWTMGGSMLAATGLVLVAQKTEDKMKKGELMFYHKSFGLLAFGLLGPRIVARLVSKTPGPMVGVSALEGFAAKAGHVLLYGLAVFLPVSGVAMGSYSGFGLPFFYTTIPSVAKDPTIAKPAYEYHKIAGQIFEYVVPLHVAGALFHVFKGQPIFSRIFSIGGKAKTSSPPKV